MKKHRSTFFLVLVLLALLTIITLRRVSALQAPFELAVIHSQTHVSPGSEFDVLVNVTRYSTAPASMPVTFTLALSPYVQVVAAAQGIGGDILCDGLQCTATLSPDKVGTVMWVRVRVRSGCVAGTEIRSNAQVSTVGWYSSSSDRSYIPPGDVEHCTYAPMVLR